MCNVYIYGDSLLKATVPDKELKYHFHLPEIMAVTLLTGYRSPTGLRWAPLCPKGCLWWSMTLPAA